MEGRKRRGRGGVIFWVIFLILVFVVVGGSIFLAYRQVKALREETDAILAMDVSTEEINDDLRCTGGYGEVEDTIKTYMKEYIDHMRTIQNLFLDEDFSKILSVESIQKDGKSLRKTLDYLEEKQEAADLAFERLSDMAKGEVIMAAVEERGLGERMNDLYREEMLEKVKPYFMYKDEDLQTAKEKVDEVLQSRIDVVRFLKNQSAHWEIKDGGINFDSDELLRQYNEKINALKS